MTKSNEAKSRYDTGILKKKYRENPFTAEGRFQVPVRNKSERIDTAGPLALVDTVTGEAQDVAEVRRVKMVDPERFVKIFVAHLHAFFELKPGTIKLMMAVMDELGKKINAHGDVIYLNHRQVVEYYERHDAKPLAKSTYLTALAELTEKGFIAPSEDANLYFINPAIFFNGDRIRLVTELRKRRTKTEKLEQRGQERLPGIVSDNPDEQEGS